MLSSSPSSALVMPGLDDALVMDGAPDYDLGQSSSGFPPLTQLRPTPDYVREMVVARDLDKGQMLSSFPSSALVSPPVHVAPDEIKD